MRVNEFEEKRMENILLISGMGGAYSIRSRDLDHTVFDRERGTEIIETYYTIKDKVFIPQNAYYGKGKKIPLLRRNISEYPPLVTRTLEHILTSHAISYTSIPCDTMWRNDKMPCEMDIVLLSTTFMWSENMIHMAIEWVKQNVQYRYLVLGGQYGSLKHKTILDVYPEVDYMILGDGETAMPVLIRYLQGDSKMQLEDIPNLAFMEEGKIHYTKSLYENLEELPKITYEGHFDRLSYESVRGCAYNCAFCAWNAAAKKFRYKSAKKMIKDIKEYVEENGISRIEINDSTLLFPHDRTEELVEGLTRLGVHWKAHSRSDIPLNKALIKKLDNSKCDILQVGFESMSNRILENMTKRNTAEQNRRFNEAFRDSKIDIVASFMIGFPDETEEEFQDTANYIIYEHYGHFYLFVFEMEDKSMPLWKKREQYGLELFQDAADCLHGGANWRHNGMNSLRANEIREDFIRNSRLNASYAILKSWQSPYEWPFVPELSKLENLEIEKLIDQLVFVPVDYPEEIIRQKVLEIVETLEQKGVYFI